MQLPIWAEEGISARFVSGSYSIVSRNLTPDKAGLPEGGHTFSEFLQIIPTGVDMDRLH